MQENSGYFGKVGFIVFLFWTVLSFGGCAQQDEQSTVFIDSTPLADEASAPPVVATSSPEAPNTAGATPQVTLPISSPTSFSTSIASDIPATPLPLPTPHVGWTWHEDSEAPGILFQLPQAWDVQPSRPKRFQAPETGSFISVQAFEFSGTDWLGWIQQHESRTGVSLADDFVKQNGEVNGRPAFLFLEGGGGANAIELYIRDNNQIVNLYFHSGVAPRSSAEMEIFQTMIESLQFATSNDGETIIPTGWVQGLMLTIYLPTLEKLDFAAAPLTISGVVETEANPPTYDFTLVDTEGVSYEVDLRSYFGLGMLSGSLRPFPTTISPRDVIQPGQTLTLTGYQTENGGSFYPIWGQTANTDNETVTLYQPFFDLHRFNPEILTMYPLSASFQLRGPWSQVQTYLVDNPDNPLPEAAATLEPGQDVIIEGSLQSAVPQQIIVERFYYLDGDCELMTSSEQQCKFYQPLELED